MADQALLIVDVQNDFCPGGALAVQAGDQVVGVLNRYIERFSKAGLPVYASRDWHPEKTRHFKAQGGPWPPHCVQNTPGAAFHPDLKLPATASVITKGTSTEDHGYSAFEGTDAAGQLLPAALRQSGVRQLYVGGLATDYCVKSSVLDALRDHFDVVLLTDAIKGIDAQPGDIERAMTDMQSAGARAATLATIDSELGR